MVQKYFRVGLVLCLMSILLLACASPGTQQPASTPVQTSVSTPVPTTASPQTKSNSLDVPKEKLEAAQKEGKVTLYSFNFTGDAGLSIQKAFHNRYGINAEIITGRGAEFIERIKTEQRMGQIVGDIIEGSPVHIGNVKEAGLTVKPAEIPNLRQKEIFKLDPLIMDPEGHIISHTFTNYSVFSNTNLVKAADEPRSWKDLLDPKWKGKMTTADPQVSGQTYTVFATYMNHNILDLDYVRKFGQQDLRFVPGSRQQAEMVARGEIQLAVPAPDVTMLEFAASGAPVKALPMEEGDIIFTITVAAIKGAPHPNATWLFINWLLSQEGQRAYAEAKNGQSIRTDMPDYRPPAVRSGAKNMVVVLQKDNDDSSKQFKDRFLVNLWKK